MRTQGDALFDAAAAWVLYVALEPYVRRRWPEALVAWSRLLSGRFKDPRVGRDVLVAVLASAVEFALAAVSVETPRWSGQGGAPLSLEASLSFLPGPGRYVAWLLGFTAVTAVIMSLMIVLLFVLLKAVLRTRAAAAGAFWVIWSAASIPGLVALTYGRPSLAQLVVFGLLNVVMAFVVARYGLLASAVYIVTLTCLLESPAALRLGIWRAEPALLSYGTVLCFLGWGLYASLSGRPFRWEGLLEGS